MRTITNIQDAKQLLQKGGILAYPTEAVYGLGCDPFNHDAVEALLSLKGRSSEKGFIVLISDWPQLDPLIDSLTEQQLATVQATWPGFTTWIFPASPALPQWITNNKPTIAIRMTNHPIAKALCADFPIVSTSANLSGQPPIRDKDTLKSQFFESIDGLVHGELGQFTQPSMIIDVLTGLRIR